MAAVRNPRVAGRHRKCEEEDEEEEEVATELADDGGETWWRLKQKRGGSGGQHEHPSRFDHGGGLDSTPH